MNARTSRAAVLVGPRTFELQSRPLPPAGPGQVRLKTLRTGVCGTDLALWSGGYPVPLPLVPGHEVVARVDAIGTGVHGWAVSDRVVPEINATCLSAGRTPLCAACREGLASHCLERSVVGIVSHDGGFADHLVVPAGCLHRVPEGVSDARAAFTEPAAAALQTFAMCGPPKGQFVVVLGPGRLGLLIVAAARHLGARVAAVARSPGSRERALRFGAELAVPPDEVASLRDWSDGLGAHIVAEATGRSDQLDVALDIVRPRGIIAPKSTPGPGGSIDLTRLVVDEVRLVGSRCGPFAEALAWLATTDLPLEELVTARFPLSDVDAAMEAAQRMPKVALDWSLD